MKYYINWRRVDGAVVVYAETTLQSVVNDLLSCLVIVVVVGMDILFSRYVGRSFIIDLFAVGMILIFMLSLANRIKKEYTESEIKQVLKSLENLKK